MGRLELRVPDSLLAAVDEARGFETRSSWVRRALEEKLATEAGAGEAARVSPARLPASPRASGAPEAKPNAGFSYGPKRAPRKSSLDR